MSDHVLVVTTTDSQEEAQAIGRHLIEHRLAACVQVLGPVESMYWWQEKIESAQEWQCIAKSRQDLFGSMESAIRKMHSYDVPEILAFPIVEGSGPYLAWMQEQLR